MLVTQILGLEELVLFGMSPINPAVCWGYRLCWVNRLDWEYIGQITTLSIRLFIELVNQLDLDIEWHLGETHRTLAPQT